MALTRRWRLAPLLAVHEQQASSSIVKARTQTTFCFNELVQAAFTSLMASAPRRVESREKIRASNRVNQSGSISRRSALTTPPLQASKANQVSQANQANQANATRTISCLRLSCFV